MARFLPDLAGTLRTAFSIGGKAGLDASALTVARTFTLPDKSGTVAMTSDIPAGGGAASVPTRIPNGATFTIATDTQALFALPIELEGDAMLVLDGALVEVS